MKMHETVQSYYYIMFLLVLYPPPYFEAEYCLFCGRRRVAVARYRMICLVLAFTVFPLISIITLTFYPKIKRVYPLHVVTCHVWWRCTQRSSLYRVHMVIMAGAASQAGNADSSRVPGLTSGLQGSMNVHRGSLLLVPQWQCVSSFVFYITI